MASLADAFASPQPGERFTFVYLPCDPEKRVTDRTLPVNGLTLEDDLLSKVCYERFAYTWHYGRFGFL